MKYSDFFTETGRINSMKVKEEWVRKHHPIFIEKVNGFIHNNKIQTERFVEKLWYYFNEVSEQVFCKKTGCSNATGFRNLKDGFLSYCSSKCSNSSAEVKETKINSCIHKFGVANPYQSPEIIEKIKKKNFDKHGVDNPMKSKEIKDKMIERSLEKHGTPWALSRNGKADIKKKENAKLKFREKYTDFILLEYSEEKFGVCKFHDPSCEHDFLINKWQIHQRKSQNVQICTVCNPIGSFTETVWQVEIENFLIEHKIEYCKNDRSILGNLEIDFYLPSFNMGIELNGLYWHSINFKNVDYHLNKTKRCENLGIQLIHVFEDEWIYKKDVVYSRLLNLLNLSKTRIYARSCKIKEISGREAKDFIDMNHIQGNIPASKRFGLFHNDELVSVMTFGALRRALGSVPTDGTYEMYRFCNKLNYSIVGGASKLLKNFIRKYQPNEIISYADRRWSIGKVYSSLGFSLVKETTPNFWYIVDDRREHRFNYTKKNLKNKNINDFDLLRIYDAGNLKFSLSLSV